MRSIKIVLATLFFIGAISISYAQEACQPLIQQIIETIQIACSELGDDQACYGNRYVAGVRIVDGLDVKFLEPGDIVDTLDLQGYQVELYNADLESWGVVVARIAPLPVQPVQEEQTISMVMFGSLEVWDATRSSPIRYEGNIVNGTNLLQVAGDFNTAFFPTTAGETVLINAREPNGRFVRVIDGRMNAGWIEVSSVSTTGDLSSLPIIDVIQGTDPSTFAPLQAMYVDRIMGIPSCEDVPTSGVLIQTSENTEATNVLINGVNIALNGTMYITADAGAEMMIDVLAGQADLKDGVVIPAGTRAVMPLTYNFDTLLPQLLPYDMELIDKLPLALLDEVIVPVAPLSQAEIDSAQQAD